MRRKNIKDRCEKRKLPRFKEICRTYDAIQYEYAMEMQSNKTVYMTFSLWMNLILMLLTYYMVIWQGLNVSQIFMKRM